MLHITNGDSAAGLIQEAGLPGAVLPWRDALHEGPVPHGLGLDELSKVRAQFISGCAWGTYEQVYLEFSRRDEALKQFRDHREVVLWFEHDLYDQLQLIQLLDWFRTQDLGPAKLSLISIGEFPGIARFKGLGQLSAGQIASLFPGRRPVSHEQLELGTAAWRAFTSPDPEKIQALLDQDTAALPFLAGALIRHLEQFPSVRNGLSRTERQILEVVAAGAGDRRAIFRREQDREERPFMGDSFFWSYLDRLIRARAPLLDEEGGKVRLTGHGREVLEGKADHVRLNGIDRWLGGVYLAGDEARWRWDELRRLLLPR